MTNIYPIFEWITSTPIEENYDFQDREEPHEVYVQGASDMDSQEYLYETNTTIKVERVRLGKIKIYKRPSRKGEGCY